MFKSLRNALIAGTFVVLPITVTVLLLIWLVKTVGAPITDLVLFPVVRKFDAAFLQTSVGIGLMNIVSTFIVVLLIVVIGYLSRFFLGKIAIGISEALIGKIPLASAIYKTVKQIVDTFSKQNKAIFRKTVLVEFPRKGAYSIGFFTTETNGEAASRGGDQKEYVFIPTTPNPTSGFLILVPKDEVIELDMTITEGMKLIVSFGAVVPEWKAVKLIAENKKS